MRENVKRGLFVGRFQPFHIGHVEVVKRLLKSVDELIIVVGSSQLSHELDNPFTAGERVTIIRSALDEEGVDPKDYYLIPVPDVMAHATWVNQVIALTPSFNIVYSNEPLTRRLFKEAGFKVENVPFYHRETYSATEVRRRMLNDGGWEELLPKSVVEYIKRMDGVSRIRELAVSDKT
jgi:nicotinamide-nucleotide adenylyltransferase